MLDPFYIKLLLSFIVGFVWFTALTVIAEKLGTKAGGAIAGLPATMLISLFFIAYTQTAEIAAESTNVVPLIVGINALFALVYIFFARRTSLLASVLISLVFWSIAALIILLAGFNNFVLSLAGFFLLWIISLYLFEKKLNIISKGKKSVRYTPRQLLIRSLIGGFVIAFAVLMAKFGGPLLGGIFASFPALTLALIVITRREHEAAYTEALLKNFLAGGTISVVVFVVAVKYSYPAFGLLAGTVFSMMISAIVSYLGYHLINKRMR